MKKFLTQMKAVLALLGLEAKMASKTLTADDQANIVDSYNKEHGENAFAEDFAAFQKESHDAQLAEQAISQIADLLGTEATQEDGAMNLQGVIDAVKELQSTVEKMGKMASPDAPKDTVNTNIMPQGIHTADYAFGIANPMFGASKRWNKIAITRNLPLASATSADEEALQKDFLAFSASLSERIQMHHTNGTLAVLRDIKNDADLSALSTDEEIGTRQFNVRKDALIVRILQLPNLSGIFDTISNVQSGDIITNILASEVSQAYQAGHVFKGDLKALPEKAIVDKVMAKVRFKDMSDLETTYLNYLNRSGSDPVKWTLIEWLVLELAQQINNERNRRAVLGHYVKPVVGETAPALFGSTGLVHRLFGYFDDHKLLPFMEPELASYDKASILDYIDAFCTKLQEVNPDGWENMTIYMNKAHKPWFKAAYDKLYGQNTDYTGVVSKAPNYDLPIQWVPNMGNLCFVFATVAGNITLLENVPGEANNMKYQRDLEEVIAFSYWKEGVGAGYVGEAKKDLAELKLSEYANQMIFMNWPAVDVQKDATTVNAKDGIIFRTAAGSSSAQTLTDIIGAREGVIYRIENGGESNATKIVKSGKFDQVNAWTPSKVGEYIKVYYNASKKKFFEVARG